MSFRPVGNVIDHNEQWRKWGGVTIFDLFPMLPRRTKESTGPFGSRFRMAFPQQDALHDVWPKCPVFLTKGVSRFYLEPQRQLDAPISRTDPNKHGTADRWSSGLEVVCNLNTPP